MSAEIDTGLEALVILGERNGLGYGSLDEARRYALDRVLEGYDPTALGVAAERLGSLDTAFLDRMATELAANAHKGDWQAWAEQAGSLELSTGAMTQQNQLMRALIRQDWPRVQECAADLANLAMFAYHHAATRARTSSEGG